MATTKTGAPCNTENESISYSVITSFVSLLSADSLLRFLWTTTQFSSPSQSTEHFYSLLFTTLVLSYIPQRAFLFIRRPYAKFLPLLAFIAYIAGTFASIHLMQVVCGKKSSFCDERPLQGLSGSIARLIQLLRVGLQLFGLTSL